METLFWIAAVGVVGFPFVAMKSRPDKASELGKSLFRYGVLAMMIAYAFMGGLWIGQNWQPETEIAGYPVQLWAKLLAAVGAFYAICGPIAARWVPKG